MGVNRGKCSQSGMHFIGVEMDFIADRLAEHFTQVKSRPPTAGCASPCVCRV